MENKEAIEKKILSLRDGIAEYYDKIADNQILIKTYQLWLTDVKEESVEKKDAVEKLVESNHIEYPAAE